MRSGQQVSAQLRSAVLDDMRRWLERAVIGLNLCPFAKSVHVKEQIHWVVTGAQDVQGLLAVLRAELLELAAMSPDQRDTTLLMVPGFLADFLDFNDFLGEADTLLEELGLQGELQIASFHPLFQFAGTAVEDIGNYSNRAPYPTLHLLREASIDRAVQAYPKPEAIYERNIQVLAQLGLKGWQALGLQATAPTGRADRLREQG